MTYSSKEIHRWNGREWIATVFVKHQNPSQTQKPIPSQNGMIDKSMSKKVGCPEAKDATPWGQLKKNLGLFIVFC
jgi:hypothetical protein